MGRLILFGYLILSTPLLAQDKTAFPNHVLEIYDGETAQLETKLAVEKMMGTYLTHPPRRHLS